MITYTASLILGLGLIALQVVALWAIAEAGWWIYCKATGKTY